MLHIKNIPLAMCLLLLGCRKEYSFEKPPTPPVQPPTARVLTTGYAEDITAARTFKSVYWIDSTLYPLEAMANQNTFATGIALCNNQVVVAGGYTLNNNLYDQLPCYWLDGKRYDLPTNGIVSRYPFITSKLGIAVVHNTIYITAIIGADKPVVWKIYDNKVEMIQLPYPKNWDGSTSVNRGIIITPSDDRVFVSSLYSRFLTYKNERLEFPVSWEIDAQNNITTITPENDPNYMGTGFMNDCAAWGNEVYVIASYYGVRINNAIPQYPCIWSRRGRLSLDFPINDIYEFIDVEVDNTGNLHVLTVMQSGNRQIYTINPQGQLISKTAIPPVEGAEVTEGRSMSVNQYGTALGIAYRHRGYPQSRKDNFGIIKNNIFIPFRFNFQYSNVTYEIAPIKLVKMQ